MIEEFLPVGSVVMLKEGTKRISVIGFCPVIGDGREFDYVGCLYPEGLLSPDQTLLFNHSDIKEIYHVGLKDQEHIDFSKKMVEARKNDKNKVSESLPNIKPVN